MGEPGTVGPTGGPDEPERRETGGSGPDDRLPAIAAQLRTAAVRFGTPVYVTDERTIASAAAELLDAFPDPWIRQYSVKANDVAAVIALATAPERGLGANVVS